MTTRRAGGSLGPARSRAARSRLRGCIMLRLGKPTRRDHLCVLIKPEAKDAPKATHDAEKHPLPPLKPVVTRPNRHRTGAVGFHSHSRNHSLFLRLLRSFQTIQRTNEASNEASKGSFATRRPSYTLPGQALADRGPTAMYAHGHPGARGATRGVTRGMGLSLPPGAALALGAW